MSFFDSILSPFKTLLRPISSALPGIGSLAGSLFGGPAGAAIGHGIGTIGSNLFGDNSSNGNPVQDAANRYVPQNVQHNSIGNVGAETGRWAGNQFAERMAPQMPSFFQNPAISNANMSNIGQRVGNMGGNWLAKQAQNRMPSFLQGTSFARDVPNLFRNIGRNAGAYGQQAINRMTPPSMQPYSNVRFNQMPGEFGAEVGRRGFDQPMQRMIPEFMQNMKVGSMVPELARYGSEQANNLYGGAGQQQQQPQQPEQLGLSEMGYAHGGPVYNGYAYGGNPAVPSSPDMNPNFRNAVYTPSYAEGGYATGPSFNDLMHYAHMAA